MHLNWNNCRGILFFVIFVGFLSFFSARMVGWLFGFCLWCDFFSCCLLLDISLNVGFHSPLFNSSFFHMNSQPSIYVCVYLCAAGFRLLLWLFACSPLLCSQFTFRLFQIFFLFSSSLALLASYMYSCLCKSFNFQIWVILPHVTCIPSQSICLFARSFASAITQAPNKFSTASTCTVCGGGK